MNIFFGDRRDAGRQLALRLFAWAERKDAIILALPRGGVPVAFEVAHMLNVALDLMLVRKLGVPGHQEVAMGALALPNICVFNHDVIHVMNIPQAMIDQVIAKEKLELNRRNLVYRRGEPPPILEDRIVILVDDGAATGATMQAAIRAARQQIPRRTIAAVPVASREAYEAMKKLADDVVCPHIEEPFPGVGNFYEDFGQTPDAEVISLLDKARDYGKGHIHRVQTSASRPVL